MSDTPALRLIEVGRVAGGFGVRGEVKIAAHTEDPLSLKAYGTLLRRDGTPALTLTGGRAQKGALIARAKEVATKEQADALRGLRLYVPREALPEPDEDEFYLADLIGLEARGADGRALGRIKAVQNFGAGDILELAPAAGGQTAYLPFTREVVPELHIADGWLLVVPSAEVEAGDARGGGETSAEGE
ncbi:MAG TPA: ribosome maturation factor RimM [Planctomycetota bacterium]|nr:ribosome maturation factor RimM [Planctomycetota bacterium]